jgi:hypothetical protein
MKLFSIIEANKSLPLVRQIMLDTQRKWIAMQEIQKKLNEVRASNDVNLKIHFLETTEAQINKITFELDYHIKEFEELGCFPKDVVNGTVAFPSLLQGRLIYLSWKLTETEVSFWHEVNESSLQRKLIDERFLLAHA